MSMTGPVDIRWGVSIPLRDGICLGATLYLPRGDGPRRPCLFTLTPYIGDTYHQRAVYFARRGWPFFIVDARGRGNSQGDFRPLVQEAEDGFDVVEWIARHERCSGDVAMWGGSYGGYAQWATAKERPPSLKTIVPAAAPCIGVDFPFRNNIFMPYVAQWLAYVAGRALQTNLMGDGDLWSSFCDRLQRNGQPFRSLDTLVGMPSATFQEWLARPRRADYADHNPSDAELAAIDIPILTITGAYDSNQPGALAHYRRHQTHGSPAARARHYLIIGPWDHSGTRTPRPNFGGVTFGPASLVDLEQLHVEWYGWTMAGGDKPAFLEQAVAYYVMGAERWRYAPSLDAITERQLALHLCSDGRADDLFASGNLAFEAAPGLPDSYRYDPKDMAHAERDTLQITDYLTDFRAAHTGTPRLFYHSEAFAEDMEVSGFVELRLWLSIDQPDTDISVSLHVVAVDGSAIFLCSDIMRARYRGGLDRPALIESTAAERYDFKSFRFVSRLIRKGERLRLVIGPLDSIHVQKNYNSGGDVSDETEADARVATVTLLHDMEHPSQLLIPIATPETDAREPGASQAASGVRRVAGDD